MSNNSFKNITQIIGGMNNKISALARKSKNIDQLDQRLKKCLPTNLANTVKAYDFYQGIIKVSVPNASIATQLRNSSPSILKKLNDSGSFDKYISIQCKIHEKPNQSSCPSQKVKAKTISSASREKLNKLSEEVTDQNLSRAIKKLGKE